MRLIDNNLKSKLATSQQTVHNDANLSLKSIASRATSSIESPQFWRESIITLGVNVTDSSVAVRKKKAYQLGDIVFAASIVAGTLYVKKATLTVNVSNMIWETVETIPSCTRCALQFDATYDHTSHNTVETFTADNPYVFYLTTSNELRYKIVGSATDDIFITGSISDFDVIKGVESKYKDITQGLIVFYILDGTVCYKQLVDGEWQPQEIVAIAPTPAVQVKAERVFDYRIVLHVMDSNENLFEVISKMEASSWNSNENINLNLWQNNRLLNIVFSDYDTYHERLSVTTSHNNKILYVFSPVLIFAENIDRGDGDKGYKVRATFDERVYNPMCGFALTDSASGAWACISVVKVSDKVLEIEFLNFNNAVGECTLTYTPGTISGDVVPLEACSIDFTPAGLVPFAVEPPVPLTIENIQDWSGSI